MYIIIFMECFLNIKNVFFTKHAYFLNKLMHLFTNNFFLIQHIFLFKPDRVPSVTHSYGLKYISLIILFLLVKSHETVKSLLIQIASSCWFLYEDNFSYHCSIADSYEKVQIKVQIIELFLLDNIFLLNRGIPN